MFAIQERCHTIVLSGIVSWDIVVVVVGTEILKFPFFQFSVQRFWLERKKDVYSILLCLWKYNLKQRVIMYSYNSINVCKSRFKKLSSLGAGYFVSRLVLKLRNVWICKKYGVSVTLECKDEKIGKYFCNDHSYFYKLPTVTCSI